MECARYWHWVAHCGRCDGSKDRKFFLVEVDNWFTRLEVGVNEADGKAEK
jgi:hypothetical protein